MFGPGVLIPRISCLLGLGAEPKQQMHMSNCLQPCRVLTHCFLKCWTTLSRKVNVHAPEYICTANDSNQLASCHDHLDYSPSRSGRTGIPDIHHLLSKRIGFQTFLVTTVALLSHDYPKNTSPNNTLRRVRPSLFAGSTRPASIGGPSCGSAATGSVRRSNPPEPCFFSKVKCVFLVVPKY